MAVNYYYYSNVDIIYAICKYKRWKCSGIKGLSIDSRIVKIDRKERKYYLRNGTVGDIPENISVQ